MTGMSSSLAEALRLQLIWAIFVNGSPWPARMRMSCM